MIPSLSACAAPPRTRASSSRGNAARSTSAAGIPSSSPTATIDVPAMREGEPLDDVRAFIHDHFDQPLNLAQLATLCALSVSRFATAFRQRFGQSPYRYLCAVRVEAAQRLLLAGVPGSMVATEVGFFDQSHLARHFKRSCGMTPSAFLQHAQAAARALGG